MLFLGAKEQSSPSLTIHKQRKIASIMTDRKITDATGKAIEESLNLARDNGNSQADPLHLAVVLFRDENSIGARVCSRVDTVNLNAVRKALQKQHTCP